MMKTLLADKFGLATHQEDKPMSAYVLTLVKNTEALRQSDGTGASQCHWGRVGRRFAQAGMPQRHDGRIRERTACNRGIGIFLPVSDQTGLKGNYDLQFDVGTIRRRRGQRGAPDPMDTDGPNIFCGAAEGWLETGEPEDTDAGYRDR